MTQLADIHCHLLPYVDDGAATMDTAIALLREEAAQGVDTVCMTPHLRQGMFETPDEELFRQFYRLREVAQELSITLCLGREYHLDGLFLRKLDEGNVLPLGLGKTILLEFSSWHSFEQMRLAVQRLRGCGYNTLIAHVERCPALHREPDRCEILRQMGVSLQCNAGSILGREGLWAKRFCHGLLKRQLVSVVASDAHDLTRRVPELGVCADYLSRKYGEAYATSLVSQTPRQILNL